MSVLGVDIGYSNMKTVRYNGAGELSTMIAPAGAGRPEQLPTGFDGELARGAIHVLVDGEEWVAAVEPARLENWVRELHRDYWSTPSHKALRHAALAMANMPLIDHLITGLPVAQYSDKNIRQQAKVAFEGTHRVTGALTVVVRKVTVLPQPVGAYLDALSGNGGVAGLREMSVIVIDPGFFSLDWVPVRRRRTLSAST